HPIRLFDTEIITYPPELCYDWNVSRLPEIPLHVYAFVPNTVAVSVHVPNPIIERRNPVNSVGPRNDCWKGRWFSVYIVFVCSANKAKCLRSVIVDVPYTLLKYSN